MIITRMSMFILLLAIIVHVIPSHGLSIQVKTSTIHHHQNMHEETFEELQNHQRRNLSQDNFAMTRSKRSFSMERYIELFVVADYKMKMYHQDMVQLYVLTLMSMVAQIYRDASIGNAINIAVTNFVVMDENESRKMIRPSAPATLRGFCWWQNHYTRRGGNRQSHHDAAILITREDLCSNHAKKSLDGYGRATDPNRDSSCDTLGLAQLGRMCDPHSSCAVIEDNGLSAAFTIAHELAHVLNIPHDDDPSCSKYTSLKKVPRVNESPSKDRFIMSRMLHYHGHPWSWSTCSRGSLTEFLDSSTADCLLDPPKVDLLNQHLPSVPPNRLANDVPNKAPKPGSVLNERFYNPKEYRSPKADELDGKDGHRVPTAPIDTGQVSHVNMKTTENYTLMPGEIFDMNVQCQLVFGQSSKICPWMKVCSRLWCLTPSGKSCKTQHMPWAEGTHCGTGKWCQKGSCVPINRSMTPRVDGSWGPWSRFTPCSRTCGGGINQSTRECNNPRPQNGGKYCVGHRIKYASCNTQDCPPDEPDFRSLQCSTFDGQNFGLEHLPSNVKWQAHYANVSQEDSCKLWCNPIGTTAFYLLKSKVKDGTPCSQESDDICVNGQCMTAGCDHVIGSNKVRDKCGICGGINSTCRLIQGTLTPSRLKFGYNSILSLPVNSSNVRIIQRSNRHEHINDINFLSLRDDEGKYLINGNFIVNPDSTVIDYDHRMNIEYSGYKSDLESIYIKQPLSKRMFVELLSVGQMTHPEVMYQYSIAVPTETVNQKARKRKKKKVRYGSWRERKNLEPGKKKEEQQQEKDQSRREEGRKPAAREGSIEEGGRFKRRKF